MRKLAIKCLESAKSLITKDDDESLKYASLELRFCIEYITYSQLLIYLNEVPNETFKKWTPKSIISDLITVDPDADKSVLIFGGIEDKKGIHASKMHFLGEDRRFSLKWANKQHNALGNFLHAPTLQQIEKGEAPTKDKIIHKFDRSHAPRGNAYLGAPAPRNSQPERSSTGGFPRRSVGTMTI